MTVRDLCDKLELRLLCGEESLSRQVTSVYCCDLLSLAMSRAREDCAWVTVMANVNALAVASLTDTSCIVLAEGMLPDEETLRRAAEKDIPLLATGLPVYETARAIGDLL